MTKLYPHLGNLTYRAEIRRDGKIIAQVSGKTNSMQDIKKFLKRYWPGKLEYESIKPGQVGLTLKVWQYLGGRIHRIPITAQKSVYPVSSLPPSLTIK